MIRSQICVVLIALATMVSSIRAEEVNDRLAAGEFSAAIADARTLPADDQSPVLAQIAGAQAYSGESSAASETIRSITSPGVRQETIEGIRAPGGASFANFDSLIELIQTTVVPDTWDLLGGPSTMQEYAQGVYVDAEGTVKVCETAPLSDSAENLKSMLFAGNHSPKNEEQQWRAPSELRCVSLRRLIDESNHRRISGTMPSESMLYLAGLSDVRFLFIDQQNDDIVIAGPVGGIETINGVARDRASMRGTLRLDFLMTCLSAMISRTPFGCTIDPTREGLAGAASVAADVQADKLPIGKAAEALTVAIGMQRVEVFGTAGDTPIGYLMVEADRHMKELALGVHPMPRGAMNYLDVIEAAIDRGSPDGLLLRLWFTASPRSVRADQERSIFEIAGTPIRLSGQNERAMADGARGNLTEDFRTDMFVADFNQHFHDIRGKYPVYGSLEAIYQTASVAELLRRFAKSPGHQTLIHELANNSSTSETWMRTPTQVESIAVLHKIRHGRTVHNVLIASGGVAVNGEKTLVAKVTDYPSLRSMSNVPASRPQVIQNWWWDK